MYPRPTSASTPTQHDRIGGCWLLEVWREMPCSARMSRCEAGGSLLFLPLSGQVGTEGSSRPAESHQDPAQSQQPAAGSSAPPPLQTWSCLGLALTPSHACIQIVWELLHLSHISIFCFCPGPCNHFMEITHALISSSAHLTFSPLSFRGS